MKKFLLPFVIVSLLFASCKESPRNVANNDIVKLEANLVSDTTLVLDRATAIKLTGMYADFSEKYPEDELASNYLFKAGELSMNLNMGNQAITYFTKLLNNYENFDKRPETIFLQAFVLENQLNNQKRASDLYKSFMVEYPDHILYKDAKASLDNMGKSLEEIIKTFEARNRGKDKITEQE